MVAKQIGCHVVGAMLFAVTGCGATEAGSTVHKYVSYLHAGDYDRAYEMVSAEAKQGLPLDTWKTAMNTDVLTDVEELSVKSLQVFSPGGTCVYTQLDFASRRDGGPYGHYIFYLMREDDTLRIHDVRTFDRIEGDGFVKVGHFDESHEPFPCSTKRTTKRP